MKTHRDTGKQDPQKEEASGPAGQSTRMNGTTKRAITSGPQCGGDALLRRADGGQPIDLENRRPLSGRI